MEPPPPFLSSLKLRLRWKPLPFLSSLKLRLRQNGCHSFANEVVSLPVPDFPLMPQTETQIHAHTHPKKPCAVLDYNDLRKKYIYFNRSSENHHLAGYRSSVALSKFSKLTSSEMPYHTTAALTAIHNRQLCCPRLLLLQCCSYWCIR